MTDAQFNQQGDAIDFKPLVDTPAGSVVVLEDLIGVTKRPLKAGELGALALKGVYELPKETGQGDVAIGTTLYWDEGNTQLTTTEGSNKVFGKAVTAVLDADTEIRARLAQ